MFMHSVSLSHSPKTRHKESSRESGSGILRKGREPRVAWESEEVVRGCLTCMRSPHTSALWVSAALFRLEYGSQTCCHVKQFKKKTERSTVRPLPSPSLRAEVPPSPALLSGNPATHGRTVTPTAPMSASTPGKNTSPILFPFGGKLKHPTQSHDLIM